RLMEAGVLQEVRMALMGHSSGSKVHATYTHIDLPVKREAIRKLEQWVKQQRQQYLKEAEHASTETHGSEIVGSESNPGSQAGPGTCSKAASKAMSSCSSDSSWARKASSDISCFPNSKKPAARSACQWNTIFRFTKAGSPMLYPRRMHNGAPETKNLLGLFF